MAALFITTIYDISSINYADILRKFPPSLYA